MIKAVDRELMMLGNIEEILLTCICVTYKLYLTVANQNTSNSGAQPLLNAAKTLAAKKNGGRPADTSPSQGYNR